MTRRQLTALAILKREGFFPDLVRNANSGYAPTKIVHFKAVQSVQKFDPCLVGLPIEKRISNSAQFMLSDE
jgi:hypothetical protein